MRNKIKMDAAEYSEFISEMSRIIEIRKRHIRNMSPDVDFSFTGSHDGCIEAKAKGKNNE